MPEPAASPSPAAPPRPRRAGAVAWTVGWVLLLLVSMSLAYGVLVVAGR